MISYEDFINAGYTVSEHSEDCNMLYDHVQSFADFMKQAEIKEPGKLSFFVFRQEEQKNENSKHEGMALPFHEIEDMKHVSYAIGISTNALEKGKEYAAGILLHELAHVLVSVNGGDITEHNSDFDTECEKLIRKYEQETGSDLSRWDFISAKVQEKRSDGIPLHRNAKRALFGGIGYLMKNVKGRKERKS